MARLDFEMGFWFMARLNCLRYCFEFDDSYNLMGTLSLNNDDDYVSDNVDSEHEMEENNYVSAHPLESEAVAVVDNASSTSGDDVASEEEATVGNGGEAGGRFEGGEGEEEEGEEKEEDAD
ncbi:hypothetical protein F2Q70_00018679 [Brassica cretica]|uniref:Uncharacterized protein n=1 Tax=Brassica cretica TaxID=69181 RepID=A0A8S9I1G1_BRACR|nr:hypothetical protein F2Q70_00018679 [Brassica cretica]